MQIFGKIHIYVFWHWSSSNLGILSENFKSHVNVFLVSDKIFHFSLGSQDSLRGVYHAAKGYPPLFGCEIMTFAEKIYWNIPV